MTKKSSKEGAGLATADPGEPEGGIAPRRRRRKEARPAEIIEAGLKEFAARGFAAARLDDVARRAGVAKGTIYRYFADKEALFLAAVESRALPVIGQMEEAVDRFPGTTEALLELLLRTVYARVVDSDLKVLIRMVIAEGENFPALTALYHREVIAKGETVLRRIVARGIARGEVRPGPVADLPIVILAPAVMAAVWKLTFEAHEPIATERFIEAHLNLLRQGLLRD